MIFEELTLDFQKLCAAGLLLLVGAVIFALVGHIVSQKGVR